MEDSRQLLGLTLDGLRSIASRYGLKPFAAGQMARGLYVRRVTSLDQLTELPKAVRQRMTDDGVTIGREAPLTHQRSADGTVKYLFRGAPGRNIEAVAIPDKERLTLCVSSQAGCKMNCAFCMTGRQGFHGNLTACQIINQVLSIPNSEDLTNIVFMGMGEPLDNLGPVLDAIEILTAPWGMAWSPKRITVSTIGKLDNLETLLDRTKVHIAISVHTPYPRERAELMPVERAYPLSAVVEILKQYDFSHQRRLSMEYIMFRGVNDDMRHCQELIHRLRGLDCRVNLIPFHAIPDSDLLPSSPQQMERFRDALNANGITATIRASRGEDIMAACGLLAGQKPK